MVRTNGDLYIPDARMIRRTNARLAGFTFLFYIAVGISVMILSRPPLALWLLVKGVAMPVMRPALEP